MRGEKLIENWQHEYQKKGIPSSFREHPSGSVVEFVEFLAERQAIGGRVLDLGCGMGRNTVYLAQRGFEVHAIDFVQGNIDALQAAADEAGVSERVHGHTQSVIREWPLEAGTASAVVDTFCYKHQIDDEERASYRRELARVLKPGGYYLLTLAGRDDGYYGPLLSKAHDPVRRVIVDPANNIPSVLFDRQDVEQEFAGMVRLLVHRHKRRTGEMHGATYERSTHLFIGIRE